MKEENFVFNLVKGVINLVFTFIEIILVLRFFLKLFSANQSAVFVDWIYGISYPFIAIFGGIFPDLNFSGFVVELTTLFALIIYSLIYFGILRILDFFFTAANPPR